MSENSLESKKRQVNIRISDWFKTNGRDFPWRITKEPFRILVAEMLLRRTTATAVARVYPDFIIRFDTPERLSRSRVSTIAKQVTMLGLQNLRAQHMKITASRIVNDFKGTIPNDFEKLSSLPGVGRYVSSAILNFAFGEPVSLVDGNVIHLMSRVFGLKFNGPSDEDAWSFMNSFGLDAQSSAFYWGIIDLVAMVCTRKSPRCTICPLNELCTWKRESGLNHEPA